ncbi:MAG: Clp protease N-terminal domain-containing protein [Pirellulales bacterium]
MYERFTERSRAIMQAANAAAQRQGHEFIGVEHVLHGLLETPDCVAMQILIRLGVDGRKLRTELERLAPAKDASGTTARLPQTRGAKRVIELAMEESRQLGSGYVGSEHVLLGLLAEGGLAAQALTALRVTAADVVAEIPQVLSRWAGKKRLP